MLTTDFTRAWPKLPDEKVSRLILLGGFLLAALVIRAVLASLYYFNPDEAFQLLLSSPPSLSEVLDGLRREAHPPLSYFLRHYMLLAGTSPFLQKLFGLIPGVLVVWASYRLGNRISGAAAGTVLAGIAALSPGYVLVSSMTRTYAAVMLCLTVALEYAVAWERDRRRAQLGVACIALTLASALHYGAYLMLSCIGAAGLVSCVTQRAPRKQWLEWIGIFVPSSLLLGIDYAIHGKYVLSEFNPLKEEAYLRVQTGGHIGAVLRRLTEALELVIGPEMATLCLALLAVGGVRMARRSKLAAFACIASVVAVCVANLAGHHPLGASRHVSLLLPFILPLVGFGGVAASTALAQLVGNRAVGLGVALLLGLAWTSQSGLHRVKEIFSAEYSLSNADFRAMLEVVTTATPRGGVVFTDGYMMHVVRVLAPRDDCRWVSDDISECRWHDIQWIHSGSRESSGPRGWWQLVGTIAASQPLPDLVGILHMDPWCSPEEVQMVSESVVGKGGVSLLSRPRGVRFFLIAKERALGAAR